MRIVAAIAAAVLASSGAAAAQSWNQLKPPPAEGHAYPDCYCTNRGVRVEVGRTACLTINGRSFTARCGMSQNSPAWRRLGDGCVGAVSSAPLWSRPSSAPRAPG